MNGNDWNFSSNNSSGGSNKSGSGSFDSFDWSDSSFGKADTSADSSFGGFGTSDADMNRQDNIYANHLSWQGDVRSDNGKAGKWCISLTLASLVSAGVAFLLARISTPFERNVPFFGLFFCFPVVVLMLLVMLIEHRSSPMNPRFSRKAQSIVAVVLSVFIFLLGCIGEYVHEYVAFTPSQYVIVLDKSGSMQGLSDQQTMDAVEKLMKTIPAGQRVGFVSYCHEVLDSIDIDQLSKTEKKIINSMRNQECTGGTDFYLPLEEALGLIRETNVRTQILMITDGAASLSADQLRLLKMSCAQKNASISCVYINTSNNFDLQQLVKNTGGNTAYVNRVESVLEGIMSTGIVKQDTDLFHTVTIHPGVERDITITAVILILAATAIGVALTLMLSRRGQKRFQLFLSPLLGVAAFVILNFIQISDSSAWVLEGVAMSLPMLVFMRCNS